MEKKEIKEEVKETPATEEVVEEVQPEVTEEQASAKFIQELSSKVSSLIDEKLQSKKVEKSASDKLEKIAEIKSVDSEIPVYKKKDGTSVKAKKSHIDLIAKYVKASVSKDFMKMAELNSKLQPLNETTDGEGAYLVPSIWANLIVPIIDDNEVVEPLSNIFNMTTKSLKINKLATQPKLAWTTELAAKSSTSATFSQVELTPYKLAGYLPISEELMEDANVDVVRFISQELGKAAARAKDTAYTVGTGSGQPTGFTGSTVATVDASHNLAFSHFNEAFFKMSAGYRDGAVWVANSAMLARIVNLKDSQNRPIYSDMFNAGGRPMILGKPVYEVNSMPSDEIWLANFQYYAIGRRKGLTIRTSTEASVSGDGSIFSAFQNNAMLVLAELRTDGEVLSTRGFAKIDNANDA